MVLFFCFVFEQELIISVILELDGLLGWKKMDLVFFFLFTLIACLKGSFSTHLIKIFLLRDFLWIWFYLINWGFFSNFYFCLFGSESEWREIWRFLFHAVNRNLLYETFLIIWLLRVWCLNMTNGFVSVLSIHSNPIIKCVQLEEIFVPLYGFQMNGLDCWIMVASCRVCLVQINCRFFLEDAFCSSLSFLISELS